MKTIQLSHWGIFIGLVVGAVIGFILNKMGGLDDPFASGIVNYVFQPAGNIFLRSLFMIVVPLVFCSLTLGVANLSDTNTLKKMGLRVLAFYITTTVCAIIIGQILINSIQPGIGLDQATVSSAMSQSQDQSKMMDYQEKSLMVGESLWPGIVNTIIPKNILKDFSEMNMLAVIFVSIMFGIGIIYLKDEKSSATLKDSLAGVSNISVMIVGWVMKIAPYAVAALVASAVCKFGAEVMGAVIKFAGVVILGYLVQFFLVYGCLLKYIIKVSPKEFYARASNIFLTAFSTSSSSATMPVTMQTLQSKFGVPQRIVSFTIPIGVTFNMDGTALFEVAAAIFVAQVFGVDITLMGQVTLIVLVLLTSIGVAGVPGGSIPILMAAMAALQIPPEGIALILGVDRLLDMGRTVVNVTGDTVAALFLAQKSGIDVNQNFKNIPS